MYPWVDGLSAIRMVNATLTVLGVGDVESLTCMVNPAVFGMVGVPLITPEVDMAKPDGSAPRDTVQVYGLMAPWAESAKL